MAVGLEEPRDLLDVPGVTLGVSAGGIRYQGRDDLVLMRFVPGTQAACTFTQNRFCAAPVMVAREHLALGHVQAVVINSGNANAGTGKQGMESARQSCQFVADEFGCDPGSVLPFSTGVIGEQLPMDRVQSAVSLAAADLGNADWQRAAKAIMTTDTVPKAISREILVGGQPITITGMSKGSGMICPNMATMLAYVVTDAAVSAADLRPLLTDLVDASFNAITVDGDTSTNDACLLAATGGAGVKLEPGHNDWEAFRLALEDVFRYLAQAIIRDGEGAEKFIGVHVRGAASRSDARAVAYTVAHSPLFKTAANASDPNWGRILAAVGRAPIEDLPIERVDLFLDDVQLIAGGEPMPTYREEDGERVMRKPEFEVHVDLGAGKETASIWTSDLSHEYVRINAEYRS